MRNYQSMTLQEIKGLNRDKTIFLMAVSPLEVHGPHLPVGEGGDHTDAMVNKIFALV